jgi:hypothetical protein
MLQPQTQIRPTSVSGNQIASPQTKPDDVVQPSADDIGSAVARHLVVPRGPRRFVSSGLQRLDVGLTFPILGGPGLMRGVISVSGTVDVTASKRATSQIDLWDGNNDLLSRFYFDATAGTADLLLNNIPLFSAQMEIAQMFANGITCTVSVLNANYGSGAGYFHVGIWYESIPIGQRAC